MGAIVGDGPVRALEEAVSAAWEPQRIAACFDAWLVARLERTVASVEPARYAAACEVLAAGGKVEAAAQRADVTRRQLYRWTQSQAGVSPRQSVDISRLQASLTSLQTRHGDPLQGYSDQAHQIRSWKRRLGITPGAYAIRNPSELAVFFGRQASDASQSPLPFYL